MLVVITVEVTKKLEIEKFIIIMYLDLRDLATYKLARRLSQVGWEIYLRLTTEDKRLIGYQFMQAIDSIGANIAEGYGRFHYLDRKKFYYNSRASLLESRHWFEMIIERLTIDEKLSKEYLKCYKELRPALNGLINSTKDKSI